MALSVAQALPTDIEQERPTPPAPARVDFPVQGEVEEDADAERGPATAWVKENQLMLTYFVAGASSPPLRIPLGGALTRSRDIFPCPE